MLSRRQLLHLISLAAAGTATTQLSSPLLAATKTSRPISWRNWSGSQRCTPSQRLAPKTVAELQQLIKDSSGIMRPVGAGHSFSPLVPTNDNLVSLSRLSGLISVDKQQQKAWVYAGTRLGKLGQLLAEHNQALKNMPDIDEQVLAGALATGTHGTGSKLSCLSSYATGFEIINHQGEAINCSAEKNPELFKAAQLSLGSLGFISKIELQNIPSYKLKRETEWLEIEDIMAQADEFADQNRNFEFYYIPFTGMGFRDTHNFTDAPPSSTELLDQNDGVEDLKRVRDWLYKVPKLRELLLSTYMKTIDKEVVIAASWQNYAKERNVRFNEMEYHLPRENGLKALKEIRAVLEKNFNQVFFPIEVRYVQGDDIWLSPFYQRDTLSIAVHRYFDEPYEKYFAVIEPILQKYHGRPHWGKINTLGEKDFARLYPKWQDFKALRKEFDSSEKFLNPYLKSLFG